MATIFNKAISVEEILGKTEQHLHFIDEHLAIHKAMVSAFKGLQKAALSDGFTISIASGFRSFERQEMIWNNKFLGTKPVKDKQGDNIDIALLNDIDKAHAILLYSALPGASRHHWGCDIDIYAQNLLPEGQQLQLEPWEYESAGPFAPLSTWLEQNAHSFDFYFPYNKYREGVAAEPWHISFAPLSHAYEQAFQLDLLVTCLSHSSVVGKQVIIDNIENIAQRYIYNVNQGKFNL